MLKAFELEPFALLASGFIAKTCITLVAGSAILQFCATTITAHGIGNGTTLVIVTSIVSGEQRGPGRRRRDADADADHHHHHHHYHYHNHH